MLYIVLVVILYCIVGVEIARLVVVLILTFVSMPFKVIEAWLGFLALKELLLVYFY